MTVELATAAFAIAFLCVLVMGYAIQRGATCTVAAVSQLVEQGKWGRFVGLIEAAIWVAGGLLLARAMGFLPDLPKGWAASHTTVIGGMMLGAGAYVNRSCVFGTIAKIGARDWVYLATPLGFLGGAWAVSLLGASGAAQAATVTSPLIAAPTLVVAAFLGFAILRVAQVLLSKKSSLAERIWAPHEATVVIGISFAIMFVAAGAWAYTDLLAELATGMPGDVLVRLLLLTGLLAGSMIAGAIYGSGAKTPARARAMGRTFIGGAAMGAGSLLIPGSNDGLILVGMPLLYPHAWIGIGTMCLAILVSIHAERLWAQYWARRRAAAV